MPCRLESSRRGPSTNQVGRQDVVMNFQKLHEAWRDKTRDLICDQLAAMGVDARLAERGRPEERLGSPVTIGRGHSLGLIDIEGSPIKWINVRAFIMHRSDYHLVYGTNGPQNSSRVRIRAKAIRDWGPIEYVKWAGDDGGTGLISRLSTDPAIQSAVLAADVLPLQVEYRPPGELWLLSTLPDRPVPSVEAWRCCELIAARLSAMR